MLTLGDRPASLQVEVSVHAPQCKASPASEDVASGIGLDEQHRFNLARRYEEG